MNQIEYRELYCPAHFGNSYEVMGDAEAAELLAEAKWWGFNVYGDWFDAADLKNPFASPGEWLLPQAIMERKLASFAIAAGEGLALDLVTTPNHVWLDQLRPELLADRSGDKRIFGQLLCPSKAEARAIILRNHAELFERMRAMGLQAACITAFAYDYGGCSCERCAPWIITFGKLLLDIREVARRSFPDVRLRLAGWWWVPQEHKLFAEWADREAPGAFLSLARHIKYGQTQPIGGAVLPEGCEPHAFVHIGYADTSEPSDVYGPWGPVVAPVRIPRTAENLAEGGTTGFMAYSEGVFDDANKAILAGISSGKFATAREVLECYAERYFGAKGQERGDWAAWLAQWGRPFEVDAAAAAEGFEKLSRCAKAGRHGSGSQATQPRSRSNWRLEAWEQRVRIFEAHQEVLAAAKWDESRLAAARRFLAEQERLYRDVWKLGLVRAVLHPRFRRPKWFAEYEQACGAAADRAEAQKEA